MLSLCSPLLNAVSAYNAASSSMIAASDRMYASASQPLKPSFGASPLCDELAVKSAETKVSVLQHLIKALEARRNAAAANSAPKFSGIDYKA